MVRPNCLKINFLDATSWRRVMGLVDDRTCICTGNPYLRFLDFFLLFLFLDFFLPFFFFSFLLFFLFLVLFFVVNQAFQAGIPIFGVKTGFFDKQDERER